MKFFDDWKELVEENSIPPEVIQRCEQQFDTAKRVVETLIGYYGGRGHSFPEDIRPLLIPPVSSWRMEGCVVYKDDGNTQTPGTRLDGCFIWHLIDSGSVAWRAKANDVRLGCAQDCIACTHEITWRNSDGSVKFNPAYVGLYFCSNLRDERGRYQTQLATCVSYMDRQTMVSLILKVDEWRRNVKIYARLREIGVR